MNETYQIELVGGPRDGEQHTVPRNLDVIRFPSLLHPGAAFTSDGGDPFPVSTLVTDEYERTKKVTFAGRRLYRYRIPGKAT